MVTDRPARAVSAQLPLIFVMGLYYAIQAAVRVQAPGNVTLDESEQMLMARWLQWGYSPQPPLYTWLQSLLFRLMGESVAAITLLRNLLMLLAFTGFHLIARREFGDRTRTLLASLSLLLILEFVWDNQRERTHSLLALTLAIWQFRMLLAVIDQPSLGRYLVSATLACAGLLSKYNYGLFLFVLLITLMLREPTRARVLDRRMLPALALASLLLTPHLIWLAEHPFVASALGDKIDVQAGSGPLHGLGLTALTVASFLSPLWLVYLLLFPRAWLNLLQGRQTVHTVFAYPVFLAGMIGLLALVAISMDMDRIRERWLQPLLFLFPIAFVACIPDGALTRLRQRAFVGAAVTAAILALAAQAWRVAPPPMKTQMTRLDHPYGELVSAMRQSDLPLQTIVTDSYYIAGSLRLHLPASDLHAADPNLRLPRPRPGTLGLLVWETADNSPPSAALLERVHLTTGCVLDDRGEAAAAMGPRLSVRYGKGMRATYALGTARVRC